MEVRGKRKFIAFLVSIGIFFILMSFMIFFVMPEDSTSAEITALGTFSGLLGAAIILVTSGFYASNTIVHKNTQIKDNIE